MTVKINYDSSSSEYNLYIVDLDVLLKSDKLFEVIVMMNRYLMEIYGGTFNILESDNIDYIMDSSTMKQMIKTNVDLIKRISRMPSAFQSSMDRFGSSSSVLSTSQFSRKLKSSDGTEGFRDMMKTKKKFKLK